jgi:hypothetical protein
MASKMYLCLAVLSGLGVACGGSAEPRAVPQVDLGSHITTQSASDPIAPESESPGTVSGAATVHSHKSAPAN